MNKLYCFIYIIIVGSIFSSCIKEDLSECDFRTEAFFRITFTYDAELTSEDLSEMESATVFLYDENDDFVTLWTIENPRLNQEYSSPVALPPGTYSFVTWFNLHHPHYSVNPTVDDHNSVKPNRYDSLFSLEYNSDNEIITRLPLSLYGSLINTKFALDKEEVFIIPLHRNSNLINITVTGLEKTENTYSFSIYDSNGKYCFENNMLECNEFSYKSSVGYSDDSNFLNTSLVVLRLNETESSALIIKDEDTGEQIFPTSESMLNDIVQMILRVNPSNDFTKNHRYDIEISFDTQMSASIIVNGWKLNNSNNEITPD